MASASHTFRSLTSCEREPRRTICFSSLCLRRRLDRWYHLAPTNSSAPTGSTICVDEAQSAYHTGEQDECQTR